LFGALCQFKPEGGAGIEPAPVPRLGNGGAQNSRLKFAGVHNPAFRGGHPFAAHRFDHCADGEGVSGNFRGVESATAVGLDFDAIGAKGLDCAGLTADVFD
jgi:hypothetical protein